MEFRLIYGGSLLKAAHGTKTRSWEKHQIRRQFHEQLKRLWETHPLLIFYSRPMHFEKDRNRLILREPDTAIEKVAAHFEGYVPLVNGDFGMVCDLDILFLRPEPAGKLFREGKGGGDIDNRLKTLMDALKMPQRGQVKVKEGDGEDPNPFFVLLQDDALVTSVRVTTDRLLTVDDNCDPAEACVIISVGIRVADPIRSPYGADL